MRRGSTSTSPWPWEIRVVPGEEGGFHVILPDFPTIITGGATAEEALFNAREAVTLMMEENRERGFPPPRPVRQFSGCFNVRVPRTLHRELVRRAETDGVSLNALVSGLLDRGVGHRP
jgi:predicted HicB family RNase H-like nuclease